MAGGRINSLARLLDALAPALLLGSRDVMCLLAFRSLTVRSRAAHISGAAPSLGLLTRLPVAAEVASRASNLRLNGDRSNIGLPGLLRGAVVLIYRCGRLSKISMNWLTLSDANRLPAGVGLLRRFV